jgi:hypothetical protein
LFYGTEDKHKLVSCALAIARELRGVISKSYNALQLVYSVSQRYHVRRSLKQAATIPAKDLSIHQKDWNIWKKGMQ